MNQEERAIKGFHAVIGIILTWLVFAFLIALVTVNLYYNANILRIIIIGFFAVCQFFVLCSICIDSSRSLFAFILTILSFICPCVAFLSYLNSDITILVCSLVAGTFLFCYWLANCLKSYTKTLRNILNRSGVVYIARSFLITSGYAIGFFILPAVIYISVLLKLLG